MLLFLTLLGVCILSGSSLRVKQFDSDSLSEQAVSGKCAYTAFSAGAYSVKITAMQCSQDSACSHRLEIMVPYVQYPIQLVRGTEGGLLYNGQLYKGNQIPNIEVINTGIYTDVVFNGLMRIRWSEGKHPWKTLQFLVEPVLLLSSL